VKILVTGAAGFIGGHLIDALNAREHEVIGLDWNPTPLTYATDLLKPGSFASELMHHEPDLVVHLAAQVGRLFGEDDVRNSVVSNAVMTTVVASECGRRGIKLAYASTSEVYGDRGDAVCHEHDSLDVLPHNIYGLSKRWGEEACRLYTDNPYIFRLSMPYGPGVPPGRGRRALDTMLWQANNGMPLTVHKGAERSWCWIGDTIDGIVTVLGHAEGGAWNVGRDDAYISMLELAGRCCDLTGASRDLIHVVDPPSRQTVVKRLSTLKLQELGWQPTVELDDGLPRVLQWVRRFDREGRYTPERQAA
jgi:nucleoside-diphosphate-sugar epimerase